MPPVKLLDRAGRVLRVGIDVRLMNDVKVLEKHFQHTASVNFHPWMKPLCGSTGRVIQVDKIDNTVEVEFGELSGEAQAALAQSGRRRSCWFPGGVLDSVEENDENASVAYVLDLNDKLFGDEQFKDVRFRVRGGGEVAAHKSVLGTASPVFAKMFGAPMQEKHSGIVQVEDIAMNTMQVFLRLVYTGHVNAKDWTTDEWQPMPLELLLDVAILSKKYMIESMVNITSEALKSRIQESIEDAKTLETILAAAIHADLGSVRIAAIEAAKSSKAMRKLYDEENCIHVVATDLQGIWPPPRKHIFTSLSKRIRLQ